MTDQIIQRIEAMEDERLRAVEANDAAALQTLLADDLHYVHASGRIEDKQEFIRLLASGERHYTRFRSIARSVRREGELTLLFGQCDVSLDRADGKFETIINYTAVYLGMEAPRMIAWHSCRANG